MYRKAQSLKLESPGEVLVVDDEKLSRDIIAKILNRYVGCDAYLASDGNEALSFLKSKEFDLLIIDLAMPGLPGTELIKIVRFMNQKIPIIIVTGNATDKEIKIVKNMGINRIVYKPFKISSLLEVITDTLLDKERVSS